MRALLLAVLLVLPAWAPARAVTDAGAEPFEFLSVDAGAGPAALAGAYTALASDSNALRYNPGGLGRVRRHEATFMHNSYVQGVTQEYLALATRQGFGLSLNYLSWGAIQRTTISRPGGTGSTFGLTDLAVTGGYGRSVGGGLSLGAAYKHLRESIDGVTGQAHAFDLGFLWDVVGAPGLSVGGAAQNIGGKTRFEGDREALPTTVRGGAAYSFRLGGHAHTLAADVQARPHGPPLFAAGAETVLGGMMALRAGYSARNETDIGLTAGVGWLIRDASIDYAVVPFGDLDLAHRLSVTVRFGAEKGAELRRTTRVRAPRPVKPDPNAPPPGASADAWLRNAEALIAMNRLETARLEVEAALALMLPDDGRRIAAYEKLGRVAWQQNKFEAAEAAFNEALSLGAKLGLQQEGVAESFVGAALCRAKDGDRERALALLDRAVEVAPESEAAKEARAQQAKLGRGKGRAR